MANSLKSSRISFPQGQQKKFMLATIENAGSVDFLSKLLKVCPRTIRDWRREKFLIPQHSANLMVRRYGVELPLHTKIRNQYWYVAKGARKGGFASFKAQGGIIGNPEIRKQKWREWWDREGKFENNPLFHSLPFKKPRPSVMLAEFMGIMMGDGGISKYQICISLHHIDDKKYSQFVAKLIKSLFGVVPSVYHRETVSVFEIVVSRIELVKYLHSLGLPIGNKVKQKFDIPEWIKCKPRFQVACVRGLVDTDGSVFTHAYKVNNKLYKYKKLCFASASKPLRNSVYEILKANGLNPRLAKDTNIQLNSKFDMKRYFNIFGSHNPKHLKRYHK